MQDKITIADAPECLNTNDKAMWLLGYEAAIEARGQCLHQIQEPAAAEQAAWHAGLDGGRAQAAPAAVAVPDEKTIDCRSEVGITVGLLDALISIARIAAKRDLSDFHVQEALKDVRADEDIVLIAMGQSLAATPADHDDEDLIAVPRGLLGAARGAIARKADAPSLLEKLRRYTTGDLSTEAKRRVSPTAPAAAAPVVLPEPVYTMRVRGRLHDYTPTVAAFDLDDGEHKLFTEPQLRALLATATGLPAQAVAALHPDDAAVDGLAALMKAKLAKQRDKGYGGWDTDCTRQRLSELLRGHVDKGDPVDVANFCAFLTARREGISPLPKAEGWVAANEGIGEAMQRACIDLPVGCEVVISLEKDAGTVHWFDQDGNQHDIHEDGDFADTINAATTAAIAATKGQ